MIEKSHKLEKVLTNNIVSRPDSPIKETPVPMQHPN
jgi:hypothetical protein